MSTTPTRERGNETRQLDIASSFDPVYTKVSKEIMVSDYKNILENEYSKTADLEHRRVFGQFFTPFEIAKFMSEWVLENKKQEMDILDPAAGFGVFPRAVSSLNKRKKIHFDLWEIDEKIAKKLKNVVRDIETDATIHQADFLKNGWDKKYDGIIANPPYFKHHYISNKEKIFQEVCLRTYFRFSIQTNIYCWFLIKAINLLDDGGRLAFIVPSEFFNANYGEKVKEYLKQCGVVLHFISVNFEENVFDNALTTSVIILAEKSRQGHEEINFYTVKNVKELISLKGFLNTHKKKIFKITELNPKTKWRNYFNGDKDIASDKLVPLSVFGKFSRGIATGANQYFTLSKPEIEQRKISNKCLRPCITKAIHAKDICFDDGQFNELRDRGKKVYLFDGEKSHDQSCKEYIALGEKQGVNQKYLTKNRDPWYALEKREISPIWVTVFGRSGLKFIWNASSCINLTCFHAFYPTKLGEDYLGILFIYLYSDTAKKLFDREKREYGGGLGKFEPNDLNKALVVDFRLLSSAQIATLTNFQNKFLKSEKRERELLLRKADEIFRPLAQSAFQ